ncbi:thioesterase II family protein [Paraburkholderia sp.]|uniref:thioesterase II family protein n=1 Tax=Paraburkholderia sp. TaxID=1926495 RepID=UPI0039E457E5
MMGSVVAAGSPPPLQLFCLAHAGGTSMLYRRWSQLVPTGVQVVPLELPGHGARRALPAPTQWPALIDDVCDEWRARRNPALPFAVFGHSMGALVGLELLHALRARGMGSAVWFGASASVAPDCRIRETHWLDCTLDQMIDKLRALGGTPEQLLADRDLIGFLMPTLRADFHLCGTYSLQFGARGGSGTSAAAATREPLDCPLAVLTGRDDPATARAEDVVRWRSQTLGAFARHRFDGGHFYLDGAPAPVLACIVDSLTKALAQPPQEASARLPEGEAWIQ